MAKKKNVPETSKEAFQQLDPSQLRETYRKIMYALVKIGEGTTEEIAASAKISHEKVWKRVSELAKQDLIYRPGNKRLMRSGRMGYTWMLTLKGVPKTEAAEKALKGPAIVDYSRRLITDKQAAKQLKIYE